VASEAFSVGFCTVVPGVLGSGSVGVSTGSGDGCSDELSDCSGAASSTGCVSVSMSSTDCSSSDVVASNVSCICCLSSSSDFTDAKYLSIRSNADFFLSVKSV
jgi:hypothetical protein